MLHCQVTHLMCFNAQPVNDFNLMKLFLKILFNMILDYLDSVETAEDFNHGLHVFKVIRDWDMRSIKRY